MKNLIIGAATNYDYLKIKPWVESIHETTEEDTHRVMILGNTTQEVVNELSAKGWELIPMSNGQPHVVRFTDIFNYLKDNWTRFKYVVTTDVRDVIFQNDPFQYLEHALVDGKKLICGSESIQYQNEPWGDNNLLECYGEYIHSIYKDREIFNVGVLGGTSEYVKDLVLNIAINSINRPIPIVDQAVFNMLINTQPYKDSTYFAKQEDGWAIQAGTTADPSKIDKFRPHLLEPEPSWKDGRVYTHDGKLFTVVHQYDRVPAWAEHYKAKYK